MDWASVRDGERCSNELEPAEARAMLSELRATPLRPGAAWDDEARARFAEFQRAEGLPATGELDDVSVARLTLRFREHADAKPVDVESANASPDASAHERVVSMLGTVVHEAETLAHELGAETAVGARYLEAARTWKDGVAAAFADGKISEGDVARLTSSFRKSMTAEAVRGHSPVADAIASYLRKEGLTLAQFVEKLAVETHGRPFAELTSAEQSALYLRVAERAGARSDAMVSSLRVAGHATKVLHAVGIAIAIYEVATAENKVEALVKVGAREVGFWAGAKVGGVVGGLVCGPPCLVIGTMVGAFVGQLAAETAVEHGFHAIRG